MLLLSVKYDIYYVLYFKVTNLKYPPMWKLKINYPPACNEQ